MGRYSRPKHTKKDGNHHQIVRELRACGYTVIDVANLPGEALDIFVGGHDHVTRTWAWVQVEIKENRKSRFTEGERAYFSKMGVTDCWQRGTVAIIAAVTADDVLNWFGHA